MFVCFGSIATQNSCLGIVNAKLCWTKTEPDINFFLNFVENFLSIATETSCPGKFWFRQMPFYQSSSVWFQVCGTNHRTNKNIKWNEKCSSRRNNGCGQQPEERSFVPSAHNFIEWNITGSTFSVFSIRSALATEFLNQDKYDSLPLPL